MRLLDNGKCAKIASGVETSVHLRHAGGGGETGLVVIRESCNTPTTYSTTSANYFAR